MVINSNIEKAEQVEQLLASISKSVKVMKNNSFETAPFTEAHVAIIEGAQGDGKSVTATARVTDAYFNDCVRVFCEKVLGIKCEVKSFDRKSRIFRIKHNGVIKRFRIPTNYKLYSPLRIFCNYHLYGIPFVYCPSFNHILEWLKNGKITNGWLIVDEAYVGMNARASMQALGKELEKQYFQFRKMQLNVIIVTPMARLIDWTMRTIPTERISCSYNKKNRKVTLTIKKKGIAGEHKFDYDSTPYRKHYRTNERITE